MPTDELLGLALEAAREAAQIHRSHLGRVQVEAWSEKGVADFVTHVDREAEARIVERIHRHFPDHVVLAEEAATAVSPAPSAGRGGTAMAAEAGGWLWYVDPLDGTTNFLHGYPMYSASVAVAYRGELLAGAVVSSATAEEWTAARGRGAYKDGQPIRVSSIDRPALALIGTGFPFKALDLLPLYLRQFESVMRHTAGVRRAGSAALDLCHLATGYFDGFWELYLSPWDIAAGTLLVREAGGVITTLDGDARVLDRNPVTVLAGNPAMYRELERLLREASG
ncbi:MAG: inositol monophosphatase [Gemmatimonadetes bacterium]|nr:inositol monophosphatase [Gemmatimonadota bacterium]